MERRLSCRTSGTSFGPIVCLLQIPELLQVQLVSSTHLCFHAGAQVTEALPCRRLLDQLDLGLVLSDVGRHGQVPDAPWSAERHVRSLWFHRPR